MTLACNLAFLPFHAKVAGGPTKPSMMRLLKCFNAMQARAERLATTLLQAGSPIPKRLFHDANGIGFRPATGPHQDRGRGLGRAKTVRCQLASAMRYRKPELIRNS